MKKILYTLVLLALVTVFANAQRSRTVQQQSQTIAPPAFVPTATGPKIEFTKLVHDYGQIEQGSNGDAVFTFRNVGSEPLILSNVSASCGCTVPDWSRAPIMSGDSGSITVRYNTQIIGHIGRAVTVHSNSVDGTERVTLRISGNVNPRNP